MSEEQTRGLQAAPEGDDSYWAALFQSEEAFGAEPREDQSEPIDAVPPLTEARPAPEVSAPPAENGGRAVTDPWQLARQYMDEDRVVQLRVHGHNKGGLLVSWVGIQGFVPASQLVDFPQFHVPRERLQALGDWHGRTLSLKLIEVDREKSRLIFSERATLVPADQRDQLLHGVRPGEKRNGVVSNLTSFGAFVDLGGAEGLVHLSELSWSRVVHPSAILKPGQTIEVLVLNVDPDAERIALSLKRLHPDPWQTAESRYRAGQLVEGVVGNVTTYGAFVIIEPELEGLIHISELAEGVFLHPRDVVRTGETVTARVLSVDAQKKRLALSLRGLGKQSPVLK